jgi:FAD/FMN-containing dehydrogenase
MSRQVRRGDPAYQKAWQSSLFNELQPARFPDLIVAPSSPQEVAEVVRHARETGLKVAVRGRGHSWCGSPLRDGGMLLDLSGLHELQVDASAGVASVTPGITSRELSAAVGEHGLGVVTRWELDLQPMPRAITSCEVLYPVACFDEVVPWAVEIAAETPFEPYPLPERAVLLQARESTPYETLFTAIDSLLPERHRYAVDTAWTGEDAAAALDRLREPFSDSPSAKSFVVSVVPPADHSLPDAAFSMIDRTFLACYSVWQNELDDQANLSWLRRITGALGPIVSGHYIAEADLTAGRTRTTRSFAECAWQRLRAIRPTWDPNDLFYDYLGLA